MAKKRTAGKKATRAGKSPAAFKTRKSSAGAARSKQTKPVASRRSPAKNLPASRAKAARTTPASAGAGASASEQPKDSKALARLREQISQADRELIKLLNTRSKLVVRVGKHKRDSGIPIYAPHREQQVFERARKANRGPLSDRTIEAIYRELMSGSFALELPLRIGYLGPPGSYSHLAATKQFGSSVAYEDLHEIGGVFTEVRRGHVEYGLVPIENSLGGGIVETLDAFAKSRSEVSIYAEAQLSVHHSLLANCAPKQIRRIHSKPEVFSQCRTWLATQYPQAQLIAAASSSRAAQTTVEENKVALSIGAEPGSAAIGSELAGSIYRLRVLFGGIEDDPSNITRFAIISKHHAKRSGDDKTSVMFNTVDEPGALVEVLLVFRQAGINLTHIDKRPSGKTNWEYTFFVDLLGHRDDPIVTKALKEAQRHCREMTVLGSYPKAQRIL